MDSQGGGETPPLPEGGIRAEGRMHQGASLQSGRNDGPGRDSNQGPVYGFDGRFRTGVRIRTAAAGGLRLGISAMRFWHAYCCAYGEQASADAQE